MALTVGGALTVKMKLVDALSAPSLTMSVIVAVPLWPATGVMVTVRSAPLPSTAMLASGTRVWLLLLAVTTSEAVSESPTVKATAAGSAPSVIV